MVKDRLVRRLKMFEEEITNAEKTNDECYILMNFTNNSATIEYFNYSDELKNKMMQSFTEDDWISLERYGFREGGTY